MSLPHKVKTYLVNLFKGSDPKEVRRPTLIEERSTCPLCIGSVDKIDDSENKAPTKENRISGRNELG